MGCGKYCGAFGVHKVWYSGRKNMLRFVLEKIGCYLPPPSVWEIVLDQLLQCITLAMVIVFLYFRAKKKSKGKSDTKLPK